MEKPNKSATHAEWAEYAISQRVPSYKAWDTTKDDLIAMFPDETETVAKPEIDPQDIGPGHGSLWSEIWVDPKPSVAGSAGSGDSVPVKMTPAKPRKPRTTRNG